jgi:hypothetical protein
MTWREAQIDWKGIVGGGGGYNSHRRKKKIDTATRISENGNIWRILIHFPWSLNQVTYPYNLHASNNSLAFSCDKLFVVSRSFQYKVINMNTLRFQVLKAVVMKSFIFCDITLYLLHASCCHSSSLKMKRHVPPKRPLKFIGLHCVIRISHLRNPGTD